MRVRIKDDTLCVKACDRNSEQCNTTTIVVHVTGYPPIAVNDTTKTDLGVPVTIPVLKNDTTRDEDPLMLCGERSDSNTNRDTAQQHQMPTVR